MAPLNGLVVALVGAVLAACAGAPASPSRAFQSSTPTVANVCPLGVAGAVVASQRIDGGAGYVFTTPGDVAELRRRVRLVARLHRERVLATDPIVRAETDDVPAGIRLNLRPLDASQIDGMQSTTAFRAEQLARGSCPQIQGDQLVSWLATRPDDARERTLTSR